MNRRHATFFIPSLALLAAWPWRSAQALNLGGISPAEADGGLKAALDKACQAAIDTLGKPGGFMGNAKVRIPLPGHLNDAGKLLRTLGQGKRVDELVAAMNQGAEQSVPLARKLLAQSVQKMSVSDAKAILGGGDTAVTQFFAKHTRTELGEAFLPIVTHATEKVGLADKYNRVASKASGLGLVKPEEANVQKYVTAKALDGLYLMIGEEEKKIRRNPVAYGSELLSKVFGGGR